MKHLKIFILHLWCRPGATACCGTIPAWAGRCEELLEVAREYKRRGLPIDVIVVDFFHWPKQGEWKFDPTY